MMLPPFQTVLDRHSDALARYLRAAVGPDEAEDCLQETLLAALRAYPSLRDESNLRGWLFTIARNKALDSHRSRSGRPIPVAEPDPRPVSEASRADNDLWASVRRLPERQRAALTLRYVGDLSHAEIGVALGCSDEAARQSVHEGLKKLRKELR